MNRPPPPINWDKFDPFTSKDGTPLVRHAVSDSDGVRFEMSMDDGMIASLVPEELIFKVKSFPTNDVKIDPVPGGGFVALFKIGKPNDESGNLVWMKAVTRPGFSASRYATVAAIMLSFMAQVGIQPNKHVAETIKGN